MTGQILKSERIVITRQESNFDRACEAAYGRAVATLGIDDDGHAQNVKGWERSSCYIRVVFEHYEHTGSMSGQTYTYVFRCEAVKG